MHIQEKSKGRLEAFDMTVKILLKQGISKLSPPAWLCRSETVNFIVYGMFNLYSEVVNYVCILWG